MNEILQERLQRLNEDRALLEAIHTIFNQQIELEKPNCDVGDTDEMLGQKFRAYVKAKEILNRTFIEIESFKFVKNNPKGFNKEK